MDFPEIYSSNWIAKTPPNSPTIKEHTQAVGKKAKELLDTKGNRRFITDNTDFSFKEVKHAIKYAGYLHDAGKAHPDWQEWARDQSNPKPNHSLRSALFAVEYLQNYTDFDESFILAISTAILHHHTNTSNRNMDLENRKKHISEYKLQQFSQQFTSNTINIEISSKEGKTFETLEGIQKTLKPPSKHTEIRLLATIFRTYIIQADHIVSANESGEHKNEPQQLKAEDFSLFTSKRPFQSQVDTYASKKHLIGLAGCGEGKTHAALQWGKTQIQKGYADGLIFALPTQTTTNNMYLNLTQQQEGLNDSHLPTDKCELHHSSNQIFYQIQNKEKSNEEIEYDTSAFLTERERKVYSAGMTVSTVDHILNTLINQQEVSSLAKGNLFNKAIIFDELHAYDDETLSNIVAVIQVLHKWDIPYFVITATLPEYIQKKLPAEKVIKSTGNLETSQTERTPYKVNLKMKELNPTVLEQYINNKEIKTVMVVKNTVREAQEFAFKLRNKEDVSFTYYSSEFTQADRNKKETNIRQRFVSNQDKLDNSKLHVLISTQVCEISLDISVDKIHTDIAPIESILQRMGRLHRNGKSPNSKDCECIQCETKDEFEYSCTIYYPPEQKETGKIYPYSTDTDSLMYDIINTTGKFFNQNRVYSFPKSIEWIEKIYSNIETPELKTFNYPNAVKEDLFYGPPRWDGEETIEVRHIVNRKQDVFPAKYKIKNETPETYWKQFHYSDKHTEKECKLGNSGWTSCHSDLYRFAEIYTVPMPRYWVYAEKVSLSPMELSISEDTVTIQASPKVDLNYSYEFGLIPSEFENLLENNFL